MSFKEKSPLVVALYLPQYYETEYNNKWGGKKGYTEWVACKRAKPLYPGHNQPRVPLNNNYYGPVSQRKYPLADESCERIRYRWICNLSVLFLRKQVAGCPGGDDSR